MIKNEKFRSFYATVYLKPELQRQIDLVRGECSKSQYLRIAAKRQLAEDLAKLKQQQQQSDDNNDDGLSA